MKKLIQLLLVVFMVHSIVTYPKPIPIGAGFEIKNEVQKVRQSFVRMEKWTLVDGKAKVLGYGSGIVISKTKTGNVILSAAHVCNDTKAQELIFGKSLKVVRTLDNKVYPTYTIRFNEELDICLIFAKGAQLPPVKIAKHKPDIGEEVFNISSPKGIYFPKDKVVPIILGLFNGETENGSLYTMIIAPGSSGSAIFNKEGEMVGLVKAYFPQFPTLCLGVKLEDIRRFIGKDK